ncbi:carbohydrate-binding module family 1 protein [Aaosphaeria arxii CBS 175.79]|uniref:AA9 family lytic polysaccharide monooxygenase n=1 Tax=Aaosphaeria arxii CBS 175.79 TaxID=1450172 RepID=A0A6A5Y2V3_9PLEO|nr:carbohydrate-binding module family 1 protein [Aaosphaeria arxii CBS 175.79]KAF2019872.1 carbohydrate-binding module family 1 protein [Aaosphaeria arxii CBS 175.79]
MFSKSIIASSLIAAVSAHQNFHQFWVNGVSPGVDTGIRMPPSNSPVEDVTSDAMACNVGGNKVPSGVITVPANEGDTIKVKWDQSGHPGPITHFLFGPVDDASQATGVGAGWFKIDELDYVDGKWANEIMGANDMTHEFKLPTGLASGEYLLRSEMLGLHASQNLNGGQFYIGCAQLKITGTGSEGSCGPTISLPGAYKAEDPNIYIPNVYNGFDPTNYTAPGGPVATCGGSGSGKPVSSAVPVPVPSSSPVAEAPSSSPVAEAPSSSPVVDAPSSSSLVALPQSTAAPSANATATAPSATQPPATLAPITSLPGLPSTFVTSTALGFNTTSVVAVPSPSGFNTTSVIAVPAPSGTTGLSAAAKYYQCGGNGWKGTTLCQADLKCVKHNDYYSQCL